MTDAVEQNEKLSPADGLSRGHTKDKRESAL